jgi:hypothetical protein
MFRVDAFRVDIDDPPEGTARAWVRRPIFVRLKGPYSGPEVPYPGARRR